MNRERFLMSAAGVFAALVVPAVARAQWTGGAYSIKSGTYSYSHKGTGGGGCSTGTYCEAQTSNGEDFGAASTSATFQQTWTWTGSGSPTALTLTMDYDVYGAEGSDDPVSYANSELSATGGDIGGEADGGDPLYSHTGTWGTLWGTTSPQTIYMVGSANVYGIEGSSVATGYWSYP